MEEFKYLSERLKIQSKLCNEVNNLGLTDTEYTRVWSLIEGAVEFELQDLIKGEKTMEEILNTPYFVSPNKGKK